VIEPATTPQGELSATAARETAVSVGLLSLPQVTTLGVGAARQLARHAGTLCLGGLRGLAAADAKALGDHRDWLLLDGLESLDVAAAKGLARHRGGLSLGGLATLTVTVATALARSRGDLRLKGLVEMTPETAIPLAQLRGKMLQLDGLRATSPATLAALARHEGGLSLGGLETLDDPGAQALAGHHGRLALDGLREITPTAAAALAGHRGWLSLAGITRLDPAAAATLASCTGRIALPALGWIATADLEELRANPNVMLPRSLTSAGPTRATFAAVTVHHIEPSLGVAIIGGGFAGIAMAIGLVEQGRHDFAIFEKAAALGSTWRDNTYPGCACDVPSQLYSYSFAPDADWSRAYAPQAEILAYIEQMARRHDIHGRTRFNTAIERLEWDASAGLWRLTAADGRRFSARGVVSAVGGIHIPHVPAITGLDQFAGPAFHTARWQHDIDLTGRNVAVIGTGATAIQVVPEIAGVAERLTVFQRTPPWILPRGDRPTSRLARWLNTRVPGLRHLRRQWLYWTAEARAIPLAWFPRLVVHPQRQAKAFLKRSLKDFRLRSKLVPGYALGCKRVLKSDDYFPTLGRDNVEVVVEPIERINAWGITTSDGVNRPVDVIVLATGFKPFNLTDAVDVRGRDGVCLADAWQDGPEAYHGVAVAGFPNLFLLMGPNTALGHNSILVMIEAQVRYIIQCLGWLERGELSAVEVRPEAQASFNAALRDRFERSVWRTGSLTGTGGSVVAPCTSWYQHRSGRNHVIWPGTATSYTAAVHRPEIAAFYTPADAAEAGIGRHRAA